MQRIICHLDLDAFFASVEERYDPSLKGKPVLVAAGPVGAGAVASPNYVARALGIKTGMSTREAVRMHPEAIVVRANYERYQQASEEILRIIYRFTPDVEPLSLDESYFELTHVMRRYPSAYAAAEAIQKTITDELQLSASIGISTGKVFAKMASDFKKPHGITLVPFGKEIEWVSSMPIETVPGIGRATQEKLVQRNIQVCGDIAKLNLGLLHKLFGNVHGTFLWNMCHGRDERPLLRRPDPKSISHQTTLIRATSDKEYVESLLLYIAERCCWRLRTAQMRTRGISIYLRFSGDTSAHRVSHLHSGTQTEQVIFSLISTMIKDIWRTEPHPRVIFLGVSFFHFVPVTAQTELFTDAIGKKEEISLTLENIRKKFGTNIIASASTFMLHRNFKLSQAGLSFSVKKLEEEGR